MAGFTARQTEKMGMLIGLGLPEELAEKCAASDADGYEIRPTTECSAYCSIKMKEDADMEVLRPILKAYAASAKASKGVLHATCGVGDGWVDSMKVLSSPDAMDSIISNTFPLYMKCLEYCDPKSLVLTWWCNITEVEYYRNRLGIFGASELKVFPNDSPPYEELLLQQQIQQQKEDAARGPLPPLERLSLEQPTNQSINANHFKAEEGCAESVRRRRWAEERAFGIPLTRRLILRHKLLLERKIRTDKDIREAVKQWHEDPAAAEKRYGHISDWDVSRVTDMSRLFRVGRPTNPHFNEDLSKWQTGSVRDMSWMFSGACSFTSDLSEWDTSKVVYMNQMFAGGLSFTSDLSKWQTGNARDMSGMFTGASSFTSDLSEWDTSKVTAMSEMFRVALSFNSDLSKWQTDKVENMRLMFDGALTLREKPSWYTVGRYK
jgi:surface protein